METTGKGQAAMTQRIKSSDVTSTYVFATKFPEKRNLLKSRRLPLSGDNFQTPVTLVVSRFDACGEGTGKWNESTGENKVLLSASYFVVVCQEEFAHSSVIISNRKIIKRTNWGRTTHKHM